MFSTTAIVAYLTLFASVGFIFLFVNLLVGYFVRPKDPTPEKLEIYECGEPAIGSSYVQFDLRFYVVALVFIVFDAEVAFLFPAATVFGKVNQLSDSRVAVVEVVEGQTNPQLTAKAKEIYQELGVTNPTLENVIEGNADNSLSKEAATAAIRDQDRTINATWYVLIAILDFFLVLFIGFAYVWKMGAFDWVRAVSQAPAGRAPPSPLRIASEESPALSS